MQIYNQIINRKTANKKTLAVLVDPDKLSEKNCAALTKNAIDSEVDFFLVGSSLLTGNTMNNCIGILRSSNIPIVLFPGNQMQIDENADALLFLSLISGRNPDMLIGRHVLTAPLLKNSSLEIIPTGYMLIDSGTPTSVSYMSNTTPIPHDKNDIAACTAIAGEMLGLKMIYLEAGSGAKFCVSPEMIIEVRKNISIPLIVGGGIRSGEKAYEICKAGADIIVVGNVLEKDPSQLNELSAAVHSHHTI